MRPRVKRAIDAMLGSFTPRASRSKQVRGVDGEVAKDGVVDTLMRMRGHLRLRGAGTWQQLVRLAAGRSPLCGYASLLGLREKNNDSVAEDEGDSVAEDEGAEEVVLDTATTTTTTTTTDFPSTLPIQCADQMWRAIWAASEAARFLESKPWAAPFMRLSDMRNPVRPSDTRNPRLSDMRSDMRSQARERDVYPPPAPCSARSDRLGVGLHNLDMPATTLQARSSSERHGPEIIEIDLP